MRSAVLAMIVASACGRDTRGRDDAGAAACVREADTLRCRGPGYTVEIAPLPDDIDGKVSRTRPLYLSTRVAGGPAPVRIAIAGPPGATAALSPSGGEPVYANADGALDPTRTATTTAGIIAYDRIPPGTYMLAVSLVGKACTLAPSPAATDAVPVRCF